MVSFLNELNLFGKRANGIDFPRDRRFAIDETTFEFISQVSEALSVLEIIQLFGINRITSTLEASVLALMEKMTFKDVVCGKSGTGKTISFFFFDFSPSPSPFFTLDASSPSSIGGTFSLTVLFFPL